MKTKLSPHLKPAGYALLLVLILTSVSIVVMLGTLRRSTTSTKLNDRNNDYVANLNAAEAALEKVAARVKYDFEVLGMPTVAANIASYRTYVPTSTEDAFWGNYQFSDGQGNVGRTYFNFLSNYSGPLPSQYNAAGSSTFTANSPVYRAVSNAKTVNGTTAIGAVQEDFLLALVPVTQYAIFYNGLLEFSTCANMTVNGRVHSNSNIFTGTGASLTFNGTVTATRTITSPAWNGQGPGWNDKGDFNGNPGSRTNVPTVSLSVGNTNVHALIDMPPVGESPSSINGSRRVANQAQIVLLVSNANVTLKIQAPSSTANAGSDPSPIIMRTNLVPSAYTNMFPFLSTNSFYDAREGKTVNATQIDLGKYKTWLFTNANVLSKFPVGSGTYPTILFVSDNRTTTSSQIPGVRITNGIAPPYNGGLGFSLATPDPLYVWGNYNATNYLASTNTTATIPSALMADAITILSANWKDINSSGSLSRRTASSSTTVNAALLAGIVPSTGSSSTTFSGGVHNFPRLLENWSSATLWLNTSLINLYNSQIASRQFQNPGVYYNPPTRKFSYDLNFLNPAKQPPGIPTALVFIRNSYAIPPPNNVTYNVVP